MTSNEHETESVESRKTWRERFTAAYRTTRRAGSWLWRHASVVITVAAIGGSFWLGFRSSGTDCSGDHSHAGAAAEAATPVQEYTCSMHPQIRQDGPGLCPICNMELVPVKEEGPPVGKREVALSPAAQALAEVATTTVERRPADVEVTMVGKVDYDETRVRTIAAWMDGRIERLHADFTGKVFEQGDPLVDLYSPALFVAQRELLLASGGPGGADAGEAGFQNALADAAREKLRLWGLSKSQIAEIERSGEASEVLTITAPIGGTIVRKQANEGMYVKEGTPLLTVADLSVVWVQLDAFESDLVWLNEGQKVALSTESYPGMTLEGSIRFIEPFVNPRTRTAKVRVEVPNPSGLLKPEMFVRARVTVPISEVNGDYRPSPTRPHTCAMHPEVRTDGPGTCPICGMDLIPVPGAEDTQTLSKLPLVVPHTAVLRTGQRAVAYVEMERDGATVYQGRTVTLGPRAGDDIVVKSGLEEGEKVVTEGNFKIDAALQILAKPSMMSLPSETASQPVTEVFLAGLTPLYDGYFATWEALKNDDSEGAVHGFSQVLTALDKVDTASLSAAHRQGFDKLADHLRRAASSGQASGDIETLRKHFEPLSEAALALERTFGHVGRKPHYQMYCPMAFDNRGASWLQPSKDLLNPYFGASMLRCGETRETFVPAASGEPETPPAGQPAHQHHGQH